MNAENKAKELVKKFNYKYDVEKKQYIIFQTVDESKRCALITIDEILNILDPECFGLEMDYIFDLRRFFNEVKKEITK